MRVGAASRFTGCNTRDYEVQIGSKKEFSMSLDGQKDQVDDSMRMVKRRYITCGEIRIVGYKSKYLIVSEGCPV